VDARKVDRIAAVILTGVAQMELWVGHAVPGPKLATVPVCLASTATVAFRRQAPLAIGLTCIALNVLRIFLGGAGDSVAIAVSWMCGLYALAVWTDRRGFLIGLAALAAGNALTLLRPPIDPPDAVLFTVIPAVVMLLLRGAVRGRQLRAEALAARAELLEHRASEAVLEERARIARELHDLVAHNVSVMVVQAGAERHALAPEQAATRDTLQSIESTGRQALVEARRLLGMLRREGEDGELQPQPGLARLGELIGQVSRAGLPVELTTEGEPVALPPGIDLCAYRIVQEALTNSLKHAGPARASVAVRYAPRTLELEVRDTGAGAPAGGGGHGLVGMRERVALYGGELEAGPCDGGFGVRARLPLP
jgi:signal transduction histidine kinase